MNKKTFQIIFTINYTFVMIFAGIALGILITDVYLFIILSILAGNGVIGMFLNHYYDKHFKNDTKQKEVVSIEKT